MAEGNDFQSIKDGSDADFEFACTPCGEDDTREEAVKYCPECLEYLCVTCTKHHGRLKATRSHKLVNINDANKGFVVVKTTKCRFHPDRDIEMYCGTHDMVYCTKCIATEHRSCSGVVGIEDVQASLVRQNEIQRLQDETKHIHERLIAVDEMKQENIESLAEQRNAILDQVEETQRNLIEHIRKSKAETANALNTRYTEIRDELKSDITKLGNTTKDVEKCRNQLDSVTSMDAGQQFVQMKVIQNTVADAKILLENDELQGMKTVSYTENTDLKTSIMTATSLGQVHTIIGKSSASRQYKVKSKKDINVRMQSDRRTCHISDVCQLQDGTILLTDLGNRKIKRLDINYNIRDHCDLYAPPTGICCTGQNEVAVKMNSNKVQFVSVGTSLTKLREISIEGGGYGGMAYCGGELFVSTGSRVNVYSTSGTLLKSIQKGVDGQKIFKGNIQHMTVSGETVIVTDHSDGAVCMGRDGTVKQEFRDGRLVDVMGTSISDDGTVFLSGYCSNNIMMFCLDGKCLGELVSKDAGLIDPLSLCYDNKRNCLIVTCLNSDTIHIFTCD